MNGLTDQQANTISSISVKEGTHIYTANTLHVITLPS